MKFTLALAAILVVAVYAADEKKKEEERPKTFRRLIPADVLRGKDISIFFFLRVAEFYCRGGSKYG